MIEYTVLISFITVSVMLMILAVGDWTNSQWADLNASLENCAANSNA